MSTREHEVTRQRCTEVNAAHGPVFYLEATEEQLADLASGYVPQVVKAMALTMLDWIDIDRRRAERRWLIRA